MVVRPRLTTDERGRAVVLKRATLPQDVDRLAREASMLRVAAHPGVVSVLGSRVTEAPDGADEGGSGLGVHELHLAVAGTRTAADLRTDLAGVAGFVAALATTVADLHDLGIVHGRIGADHVVVDGAGRPVLCGFAGAGRAGEVVRPGRSPLALADDVAAVGRLLAELVEATEAVDGDATTAGALVARRGWPARRRRRPRRPTVARRPTAARRSLLALAHQAVAPDPTRRPTARTLAAAVLAAVPDARLPGGSTMHPADPRPRRPDAVAGAEDHADDVDDVDGGGGVPTATAAGDAVTAPARGSVGAAPRPRPADAGAVPASSDRQADPVEVEASPSTDAARRASGRRRTEGEPAAVRRSTPRHRATAPIVAGVGVAVLVIGAAAMWRGASPSPPPGSAAPSSASSTTAPPTASTTAAVPTSSGPTAMVVAAGVVERDGVRYGVGDPGDLVVVGDWDCDGDATVAVIRPATGAVYVFDGWAAAGRERVAQRIATIAGATEATSEVAGPDGCPTLVVVDGTGRRTPVPT